LGAYRAEIALLDYFVRIFFPLPYYKVQGDRAIVILGNYVEELFGLKKQGVLKTKGIFE
jgi:hypothetical protein